MNMKKLTYDPFVYELLPKKRKEIWLETNKKTFSQIKE